MIEIKDIQGQTRVSVPIQEGAKGVFTLMNADYIQLSFSSENVITFKLGDYADLSEIEYEGLGGKIAKVYEIVDMSNVNPTYNNTTGAYDYNIRLDAYYWKWKNKIFKYTPESAGQEASWSLTAALDVHLNVFLRNLKALGYTYKGTEFTYSIDSTIENKAVSVTYDNINLLDALFTLASENYYDCDCWVTDNVIHFGRNEFGDPVKIERNVEADSITKSESKGKYATRIYAFGSTRNIPENYRPTDEQAVVNGVVQKRLMLPADTPYIDAYPDMTTEEAIEDVVVFDDIYPRRVGTLSDIQTVDRDIVDGDEIVGTFKAYQYKDVGLTFKEEYKLEGQELKITFQSGKMNGMEFAVQFNPNDSDPAEQLWEIIRNEDYGRPLPDDLIKPENGDKYILSGFDIKLVSDQYIPAAEEELKERAQKYADIAKKDDGTYNATLYSDYVYEDQLTRNYEFGQRVNLIDDSFFENGRESRIIGWEVKLDIPFDSPVYTIGESMPYSRIGELEDKVDSITYKGQTYQGSFVGGGLGVYVIKTNDSTAASDSNVYSAKRSKVEFLSRKNNDSAQGVILFAKKIGSLVFVEGWNGKGWEINEEGVAFVDSINARQNVFVKNRAGSDTFVSGFPNGIGWDIAPYKQLNAAGVEETKYRLEIDDINVRGRLRVYEFIISQLRGENDNVIFAGMMKVDHYDESTRRIYLDTDEGVLYNPFRAGDILMVQRFGGMPTEENDYNVIKQYELRVTEASVGSLSDGEKRLDWITFSNFVGELTDISRGDVLTRVDSVTDLTRKGIVKITTIDEIGAPYLDVVYGMKTDPENATKARFGNLTGIRTKSGVDLTGIWGIYGNGAYFENSTYILDNGQTIEQQFSIMNGEFNSYIKDVKNNMSLEPGNILRNSAFSDNLDYWVTEDSINFWGLDSQFIYANEDFISEKSNVSDIITDGTRNVLRIRNSYVLQRNDVMNFLPHEEGEENKYSFSLFYKVITAGTLIVGIDGSEDFYIEQEMQPTTEYQKISKIANWDEQGDFKISYTGEIYIYGVSLFYDEIANATIHLETLINQTSEQIKLMASKEYVDEQTGEVLKSVEAELSVMAGEIALKATQSDIDEATGVLKTELESKISVEAGRITAISSEIDDINSTISTSGWITEAEGNTLFASKSLENGNKIISYINQTATTTTISSSRINLRGAVTYSDLDSALQDRVDAAGGEALDKAIEAYNKAQQAYNLADGASDTASSAYTKASTAITNAANALNAANEAQTSVDRLPGWSKEKDIITALEDATVIVGGYISTSMIDVDNLYVKKLAATQGTVGAFSIDSAGALRAYSKDKNEHLTIDGPGLYDSIRPALIIECIRDGDKYKKEYVKIGVDRYTTQSSGEFEFIVNNPYSTASIVNLSVQKLFLGRNFATESTRYKKLLIDTETLQVYISN